MTFAETEAACSSRGLVLCQRSCAGQGCFYNNGYVWTGMSCDGTALSPAPGLLSPPSPPPAPPSPVGSSFSVLALRGDADAVSSGVCITSPTATATPGGTKIAAQCCTASGECKRTTSTSNADCIAGDFSGSSFVSMTFAETEAACSSRGLVLCQRSCAGQGCFYNQAYVWTGIPCTGSLFGRI